MNKQGEPYIGMPVFLGDDDGLWQKAQDSVDTQTRQWTQGQQQWPESQQMQPQRPENQQPQWTPGQSQQPGGGQGNQTMVVGMAYVPWQKWQQPYDAEEGLQTGTMFPDLNLPFLAYEGGVRR